MQLQNWFPCIRSATKFPSCFVISYLLLFVVIFGFQCVDAGKKHIKNWKQRYIPGDVKEMYEYREPSVWKQIKYLFLGGYNVRHDEEWVVKEEKKVKLTLEHMARHMEKLDQEHERLFHEHLLENTDILILSPTDALEGAPVVSNSILNPVLYNGKTYNIVFKIGNLYPTEKPYLSLYLSYCKRGKPKRSSMIFIKTMYVDPETKAVTSPWANYTFAETAWLLSSEYTDPRIFKTKDGAWVIRWTVPSGSMIFPSKKYCLVFDMFKKDPFKSRFAKIITKTREKLAVIQEDELEQDPSQDFDLNAHEDPNTEDLPKFKNLETEVSPLIRNLHDMKPGKFISYFHPLSRYHKLKMSNRFEITRLPPLFSEAWFARQFGGRELSRFLGGDVLSFKYFQAMYNRPDAVWSQELFEQSIDDRAVEVSNWMTTLFQKDTPERGRHGYVYHDTGYGSAESRRAARMRALGLLYHPHGRKTLEFIGKTLLRSAENYQKTVTPMGNWKNLFNKILVVFQNFWDKYLGGFRSSRMSLNDWIQELKILCNGEPPTQERLDEITKQLGGVTKGRVSLPFTGEYVHAPEQVKRNIVKIMTKMVAFEIKMVILQAGQRLLREKSNWTRWVEAFYGTETHDLAKYMTFASMMRVYGTKFVQMAKHFEFETEEPDEECEDAEPQNLLQMEEMDPLPEEPVYYNEPLRL